MEEKKEERKKQRHGIVISFTRKRQTFLHLSLGYNSERKNVGLLVCLKVTKLQDSSFFVLQPFDLLYEDLYQCSC